MSNDGATPNLLLPQLTAFRILEIDAKHYPKNNVEKVRSRSREKFNFDLEIANSESDGNEEKPRTRITLIYSFDGEWRDASGEETIITIKSVYRGTFNFLESVDHNAIEILMGQDLYRITLASQLYPMAQTHIEAQLKLMGVNARRKPGLDPKMLMEDESEAVPEKVEAAPTKRKVRASKTDKS